MSQQNQTKTNENAPNPITDELGALLPELTVDQIRFVVARQEHSSDRATAEFLEISPDTVKSWKYKGAPIDKAVHLMAVDGLIVAQHLRRRNLAKAMLVKVAGLDSDDERMRQGVSTEIIEWEMGKATQGIQHSGPEGGAIVIEERYTDAQRVRGLGALFDAIRSGLIESDPGGDDAVDAPERATVGGVSESSG